MNMEILKLNDKRHGSTPRSSTRVKCIKVPQTDFGGLLIRQDMGEANLRCLKKLVRVLFGIKMRMNLGTLSQENIKVQ